MKELIRQGELDKARIDALVEFAKANGGIDAAYAVMRDMQREADAIIAPMPDSDSKEAFRAIFDYIIARDR